MVLLAKIFNDYVNEQKNVKKSFNLHSSKNGDKMILKSTTDEPKPKPNENIAKISVGFIVLYFLCGGVAAYFSWKHNSVIGWTTGYKVAFSTFAFFCPIEYISIYFTYKSDFLKYMERTKTEFIDTVVPSVSSISKDVSK